MPSRGALAEFLSARRAQVQPEDVGIARDDRRRVIGLRREEVAALAGISVDYYLRLERGIDRQPSAQVLHSLARALRLDPDGARYMFRVGAEARPPAETVPLAPEVSAMLHWWEHVPAYVSDAHHDILAVNAAARALSPDTLVPGRNMLLDVFTWSGPVEDESAWRETAHRLVAALRYGADPASPRLHELLGELTVTNPLFRSMWASCEVQPQTTGTVLVHIDRHGWVELRWLTLDVPGVSGVHVTTFFAESERSEQALGSLIQRTRQSALPAERVSEQER